MPDQLARPAGGVDQPAQLRWLTLGACMFNHAAWHHSDLALSPQRLILFPLVLMTQFIFGQRIGPRPERRPSIFHFLTRLFDCHELFFNIRHDYLLPLRGSNFNCPVGKPWPKMECPKPWRQSAGLSPRVLARQIVMAHRLSARRSGDQRSIISHQQIKPAESINTRNSQLGNFPLGPADRYLFLPALVLLF